MPVATMPRMIFSDGGGNFLDLHPTLGEAMMVILRSRIDQRLKLAAMSRLAP
jgi:hypothetical protein